MQSAGKITKQNISKIFQMKTRFQQNQLFGAKPEKEIYIDKRCQKKNLLQWMGTGLDGCSSVADLVHQSFTECGATDFK